MTGLAPGRSFLLPMAAYAPSHRGHVRNFRSDVHLRHITMACLAPDLGIGMGPMAPVNKRRDGVQLLPADGFFGLRSLRQELDCRLLVGHASVAGHASLGGGQSHLVARVRVRVAKDASQLNCHMRFVAERDRLFRTRLHGRSSGVPNRRLRRRTINSSRNKQKRYQPGNLRSPQRANQTRQECREGAEKSHILKARVAEQRSSHNRFPSVFPVSNDLPALLQAAPGIHLSHKPVDSEVATWTYSWLDKIDQNLFPRNK
jgi:hypothetical protein